MASQRRVVLGLLFFALLFFYFGVHAYFAFVHVVSYDGWYGEGTVRGGIRITGTDPKGPATALQAGDEFLAINGITPVQDPDIMGYEKRVPPGTAYRMTIRRNGQEMDVPLTTAEIPPDKRRGLWDEKAFILIYLIFLLTGLAVFLLKPDNQQAWLLALMLGTFTGLSTWVMPVVLLGRWAEVAVAAAKILCLWFLPLVVHFFLNFPQRLPILERLPKLETFLYWPLYLFILPFIAGGRLPGFLRQEYFDFPPIKWLMAHFSGLPMLVLLAYIIAGLICLIANYRVASQGARRRLRVVMIGSGVGFFCLLVSIVGEYVKLARWLPGFNNWLEIVMLIALPFVPLSFAYAIIRHKVIPVSLMIRRGVRYVLVSRGSILLQLVTVAIVMFFVMDAIFYRLPGLSGRAVGVTSAIVGIVIWNLNYFFQRRVLAPAIDRRFFRRSYDSQQIMADLADSLRSTTSLPQLCEQVAIKIQTALQTESVTVLLRDEATGDYLSGYACEYDSVSGKSVSCDQRFCLPHFAESVAKLQETGEPIEVEPSAGNGDQTIEAESLRQMKSALLLPLRAKEGMPGIISLGARLGDLPFSRDDKHLLMSVAGPTTFAIENARLVERMIEQARRREEIEAENEQRAKELEEARQLQLSMLPKHLPQLPGLEIAAYMKTATEVGGDYYDFHLSDHGGLTVAVGDATGHGLRAGTVVTAMKSLFQCFADEPELLPAMNRSSRVLKQMNLRSLFMGLTVIKLLNSELRITSGGMPPMLIYRAKERRVEEVLIKAMPLGSVTGYKYRELEFALACGDVVVLMSDGFPERFNPEGEMFDYERVTQSLAEIATHSPQEIIQYFVNIGDQWADGRPQDDDVTFVVLKVSERCSSKPEMANV